MAGGVVRVASGKHTRRAELEAVRQVSLAALVMLVVQYGLGIILNLYIAVPSSDAHAGIMQEIANGPLMLTGHALLGLALIGDFVTAKIAAYLGQNAGSTPGIVRDDVGAAALAGSYE